MCEYYCNVCGRKIDGDEVKSGIGFDGVIGDGSKYCGSLVNIDLCADCLDQFVDCCRLDPLSEINGDYLEGAL